MIQWSGSDPNFAKIGVNFGGGMELVHNLSGIEMASDIDCINNATGSEVVNVVYNLSMFGQVLSPSVTATTLDPTMPTIMPTQLESRATDFPSATETVQPSNAFRAISGTPAIQSTLSFASATQSKFACGYNSWPKLQEPIGAL